MKILKHPRATVSGLAVAALTMSGLALSAAPADAAPTSVWDKVAACESGGNWHINTGNGYYGGLQFSLATWRGYGGSGNPASASKSAQIAVAERVLKGQGWGAWPVCSVKAGARGYSASTSAAHASTAKKATTHKAAPKHRAAVKVSGKSYTVKRGDTLAKIAGRLDVRGGWQRLADANPQISNPNVIYVGQHLHLPA